MRTLVPALAHLARDDLARHLAPGARAGRAAGGSCPLPPHSAPSGCGAITCPVLQQQLNKFCISESRGFEGIGQLGCRRRFAPVCTEHVAFRGFVEPRPDLGGYARAYVPILLRDFWFFGYTAAQLSTAPAPVPSAPLPFSVAHLPLVRTHIAGAAHPGNRCQHPTTRWRRERALEPLLPRAPTTQQSQHLS